MTDDKEINHRSRRSFTNQERREQFQTTHETAMAAIEAEAEARRRKTEKLPGGAGGLDATTLTLD